jgi:hypothetical protein
MGSSRREDRSPTVIVLLSWVDRSHRRRLETLRALPPESMPIVFEALCDRVGREDCDVTRPVVGFCDEWLAEAGCDDVREDWDEPYCRLIGAAARLDWRLADPEGPFEGRLRVKTLRCVSGEVYLDRFTVASRSPAGRIRHSNRHNGVTSRVTSYESS